MSRSLRALALALALSATFAASAFAADAKSLTVSAAASLTNAFGEIKPVFEKANPGVTLAFNFAASGPLLKQIEAGAPVDVFATADQETMDKAAAQKLILAQTRTDFAANVLTLVAPADSATVKGLDDLGAPAVTRIAVGQPESVPAGRYAREVLTEKGLWEKLAPKYVMAESVRQALDFVGRGEAEAGFVYATDAKVAAGKVRVVAELQAKTPVTYPAAVVATSKEPEAAKAFLAFLTGPEGQAILAKYGFKTK